MGLVSYDYLYPLRDNFLIHGGASLGSSSTEISNKRSNDPVWGGS
ncbi:hypothetical protein JCM19233_4235 [Vibrio astriarenae]|nr:hypothetical protein JCM19233_4235 [Vibrio sp. C7]